MHGLASCPEVELNSSASGEFGEKALDFYEEPHLEAGASGEAWGGVSGRGGGGQQGL